MCMKTRFIFHLCLVSRINFLLSLSDSLLDNFSWMIYFVIKLDFYLNLHTFCYCYESEVDGPQDGWAVLAGIAKDKGMTKVSILNYCDLI